MGTMGPTGHGRRVLPPRPGTGGQVQPPRSVAPRPEPIRHTPSVENPYVWPWGQLSSYQLVDETVTVDGVDYDVEKIRALVLERHTLAMDLSIWRGYAERRQIRIEQLERRLGRADTHLRRRTAALVRLIAKKGPRLS